VILQELRAQAWKYGCIAAVCLALAAGAAAGVQTIRLDHAQTAAAKAATSAAASALAASEAARTEEQTRARYIAGVGDAYERGKADAQAAVAGVLDDVRAGRYVLRSRFQCPAIRSAPAPPAGPGRGDGAAAPAVLSSEDVQFLVRFAGDAEGVRQQLGACQAVIAGDRKVIP
jgi:hypothetical protein